MTHAVSAISEAAVVAVPDEALGVNTDYQRLKELA